jgi:hypothetical protein
MTDEERELLKVGADAAFKPFADLAERLFGGSVEQIGGAWEDRLKVRRQIRRIKLMKKLQEAIEDAGFAPNSIQDAIWIPALQEASLQDDDTLQTMWANILANAADPRGTKTIEPIFIEMLKGLTSREVRFLDVLTRDTNNIENLEMSEVGLANLYLNAGLASNARGSPRSPIPLTANGMLGTENGGEFHRMMDILQHQQILVRGRTITVSTIQEKPVDYAFTQLGRDFLRACQKPKP